MREIKFRAWVNEEDEEYSRMVHSEQSILTILGHKYGGTGIARPAGFSDIDNQPKPERYVLMQYTGLKDKNGREIYEGDIVDTFDGKGKIIYEPSIGSFAIEYSIYKIALPQYLAQINAEIKVIGNIYENPELLEVSV